MLSRRVISTLLGFATLLSPLSHADIGATHTAVISEFASFNTPGVLDGNVQAIAIDGDMVYVGGTFTQIQEPLGGEILNQPYLFAYSKSTGNVIRSFDPQVNNAVLALETTGDPEGGVFAGGTFGNLNGEFSRGRLAKIGVDGDRVVGFAARPNAAVETMVRLDDTLYIGGVFDAVSETQIERLAAVDTTTGAVSPDLNLDFGGLLTSALIDETQALQSVQDVDVTTDGRLLAITGNFITIDGIDRPRLAVIELEGQARVSDWNTNVNDRSCPARRFPNYIRGIDISPDNTYLITGSTGARAANNPACDTIIRYELTDLTNSDIQPTWINWTGGDSVFDVVSTGHAIYVGGHFRWLDNANAPNSRDGGPGSVARLGLAALDPRNGLTLLDWRADRNPRGLGTFALISEEEGLYVGDDTDFLNGSEHAKLKFIPVTNTTIERPEVATLPANILGNNAGRDLTTRRFNGANFGDIENITTSGYGIRGVTGAIAVGNRLFHARGNGTMRVTDFDNGEAITNVIVDLFGLTSNEWDLASVGAMFFDHARSRVYYTYVNDSRLYYRAFTPANDYFGPEEFVADVQGDIAWGDVTGMDIIGDHLYFTRSDSTLYRADVNGVDPVTRTTVEISGPDVDGISWDGSFFAFIAEDAMAEADDSAEFEFESSGSDTFRSFRTFTFDVVAGEPVVARLEWLDASAELDLRIRDANDVLVAADTSAAGSPKWLVVPPGVGGTYTASVQIQRGSTSYQLQINPVEEPPAPLADFEFSSSGSADAGRFQAFDFDVVAGELVEATVTWDDADADVRVFLRDETGTQVDRNLTGSGSASVSVVAESSGVWSIAVQVNSDNRVVYNVLVDTTTDFEVPEPLADFEFSGSGSFDSGRFRRFEFDVVAGELVEASVTWDDPTADVRVFLRDETVTQVDRNLVGSGSATVSAIAESSGTWSIAIQVNSDNNVAYNVLVDTTTDFEAPEPLADFEFSSSGSSSDGRFQVFRFDVAAGEVVSATVTWMDPASDVRVFLRDETGTQVDRLIGGAGVAEVGLQAASSGEWSIAVQTNTDERVSYTVLVDTL